MRTLARPKKGIVYPESDGEPIAENTLQFQWIVTIEGNLEALYAERDDVFVAGDLLWYPVEGDPTIRVAPDALVVYGRPDGHRGSYRQWEEGGIAPHVVWEILSPGNRAGKMISKFQFYEKYGVEEYYVYDPDDGDLFGWIRRDGKLEPIANMAGWISPRMQIRFEVIDAKLHLFGPDGKSFLNFVEIAAQKTLAQRQAEQAQRQAEQAQLHAEQAQRHAEQAQHRTEQAQDQAEQAQRRTEQAQRRTEQAHDQAEQAQRRAEQAQHQAEQAQRQAEQAEREKAQLEQRSREQSEQIKELQAKLQALGGSPNA